MNGGGALLRVSAGERVGIVRSGAGEGTLTVGNATIAASGSVSLEAGGTVTLASAVDLSSPRLDLASAQVHLGDPPPGAVGTVIRKDLIERLAAAGDVLIRGVDEVWLHGDLALGSRSGSTPSALTFDTPLLRSEGGGTVRVAGAQFALRNSGNPTAVGGAAPGSPGLLDLDVDSLALGPGRLRLADFARVSGRAGNIAILGTGSLAIDGTLGSADKGLATGQVTSTSGASYEIGAVGGLFLARDAQAAAIPASSLGGRLALRGSAVVIDTALALPAGSVEISSTSGPLTLGPHAAVDVSGRAVDFQDVVRFAPAGAIRLAATGDLTVDAAAVLDLSGSDRGGDAGSLVLSAGRQASVAGDVRAQAQAGHRGAAFSLDAGSVPSFPVLSHLLEQAGFTESREIRLRDPGQDLRLEPGDRISAHDVSLRSDAGHTFVGGTVGLPGDTSHPAGGRIELVGGAGVEVASTSTLDARAAVGADASPPASGRVLLSTTEGSVIVSGATIDVTGGRDGGSIVVRAPRTADGVAVEALDGQFKGAADKVVQGLRTYETSLVDEPWMSARLDESATWLAAARSRSPQGIGGFDLAPAIVARSAGSLSISGALSMARAGPQGSVDSGGPGHIAFVAGADIEVAGTVSDGFANATRTAALLPGRSFGLDFEAVGNVLLRRTAVIRTGSGDIAIRAGGDVTFEDPRYGISAPMIYTAGQKTSWADGFQNQNAAAGTVLGEFPTRGGNVDIQAGGDIVAPLATQTASAWLFRYGGTNWKGSVDASTVSAQASWSVVYKNFEQGVAALGGGDVRVRAGGNITRLQVSIPTTGQVVTPVGGTPAPGDLVVRGGGDMVLSAGGDIRGGLFLLGRGSGDLRAAGNVLADPDRTARIRSDWSSQGALGDRTVGTLVGLGDATARITSGGSASIEGAFDPMRQGLIGENLSGQPGAAFVGYGDRTSLEVVALGGPVTYLHNPWASVDFSLAATTSSSFRVGMTGIDGLNALFAYAPPTLKLASLASDASLQSSLTNRADLRLESAPRGTIEVLAQGDARLRLNVTMEANDPKYARNWRAPYPATGKIDPAPAPSEAFATIHLGDPAPARIYAIQGSVCAQSASGSCLRQPPPFASRFSDVIKLTLPKPLHIEASKDLLGGYYDLTGSGPNDVSLLSAGRDVYQPVLELFGQGSVIVQAGRDVVLGEGLVQSGTGQPPPLSGGAFVSQGSLRQGIAYPALSRDRGVDLFILAGVRKGTVDYDAFAAAYLDPASSQQRAVKDYFPELRKFMKRFDPAATAMAEADLVAAFRALPQTQRQVFLTGIYFEELRDTGIDYNNSESPRFHSYDRGFHAVATLFPVDPAGLSPEDRGNILLNAKRVETNASASVSLLAPYGRIAVGTDTVQGRVDYSQGGVVTRRGGNVHVMADENIDLFSSRVFTLQGGDITMWTSNGSITAGSGSKTSVFQKPLSYTMSPAGVVQVDAFGLQTGAGIGVLDATGNSGERPRSRLDLIAPRGEVNAGDAGIRVVGDLNIAAAVVVGIENIQVSGASQGVPKVEPPNVAVLTAASQVAQAATEGVVATQAAARGPAPDLPSIITVEVVGYEDTDAEKKKKEKK
jgi:hypothetical protein